jgi:hypothetical protein
MSKSYQKDQIARRHHGGPIEWGCVRVRERECIRKELCSYEYGDIMFPLRGVNNSCVYDWPYHFYITPAGIRKEYYVEIQHILNDFFEGSSTVYYWNRDFRKIYLEHYAGIKEAKERRGNRRTNIVFFWIYTKKVREIIKAWEGDPIDALYYLLEHKILEQAVREYRNHFFNNWR